jgi:hypothetical protein
MVAKACFSSAGDPAFTVQELDPFLDTVVRAVFRAHP